MKNWANKLDQLLGGDESELHSANRYKQTKKLEDDIRRSKSRKAKGAMRMWNDKMG